MGNWTKDQSLFKEKYDAFRWEQVALDVATKHLENNFIKGVERLKQK